MTAWAHRIRSLRLVCTAGRNFLFDHDTPGLRRNLKPISPGENPEQIQRYRPGGLHPVHLEDRYSSESDEYRV
ncbi:hypothetical protein B0H17DRAFT_1092864 [Mycena rosella]|uniref:Uncharacterized protein n=1 Tax=Mycena rosella TaxID=1033263 RepID=A0AAD7CUA4_MYCRO|nr:hypothetical protein B0H17DRAFT_1092864 [Mycena rosella]